MLQCSLCKRYAGPEDDGKKWRRTIFGAMQGSVCEECDRETKKNKEPKDLDFSPRKQPLIMTPALKKHYDGLLKEPKESDFAPPINVTSMANHFLALYHKILCRLGKHEWVWEDDSGDLGYVSNLEEIQFCEWCLKKYAL